MIVLRFDLGDTVIDQHGNHWTVDEIYVTPDGAEVARCQRFNRPGGLRLWEFFAADSFVTIEPVIGGEMFGNRVTGARPVARSIDWWLECSLRAIERVANETGTVAVFEPSLLAEQYAELLRRLDHLASALNAAGLLEIRHDGETGNTAT